LVVFFPTVLILDSISLLGLSTSILIPIVASLALPSFTHRRHVLLAILGVAFSPGLFFLGYTIAATNYVVPQQVKITFVDSEGKDPPTTLSDNLAFSGSNAVLLFDDHGVQTLVRTDKNVQISFGHVKNYAALRCVDWRIIAAIREYLGRHGCFKGLERWYE
jgi:hypothetical protein